MNVPYYYRSVDFDRLVREYPPSQDYAETVFLHDRRQIAELQNRRFVSIVESAWRNPFYRKHWEAHGLRPGGIRSIDDLGKLPMVAVEDFKDSIKTHPPFGEHPGLSRADGIDYVLEERHQTITETVASMRSLKPNRPVGEIYEYSNLNFVIAGLLVERRPKRGAAEPGLVLRRRTAIASDPGRRQTVGGWAGHGAINGCFAARVPADPDFLRHRHRAVGGDGACLADRGPPASRR